MKQRWLRGNKLKIFLILAAIGCLAILTGGPYVLGIVSISGLIWALYSLLTD